jgi:hypothetical protein
VDLHNKCSGTCYTANAALVDPKRHPILHRITNSFNLFSDSFQQKNDNYKEALIFNYSLIKRSMLDDGILDVNFFNRNVPVPDISRVSKLRVKDFIFNGVFKTLDDINHDLNMNFSLLTYMRMREALMQFYHSFRNNHSDGTSVSIENFLRPAKGNAKRIRLFLDREHCTKDISKLTTVKTFCRLTGMQLSTETLSHIHGIWNFYFLPNKIREFSFRFFNNSLPLNTRLSHFVDNHGRACTFCVIKGNPPYPDESFTHFFSDCASTKTVHDWFFNNYFRNFSDVARAKKKFFFTGTLTRNGNTEFQTLLGRLSAIIIQFLIWEMKIKKRVLSALTLDNDFTFLLNNLFKTCRHKLIPDINRLSLADNRAWKNVRNV